MYGKNVIKINYCDAFYVIYVLNSTQLLCLHCNYVVVFSYRNTGSNKRDWVVPVDTSNE